jgi:hypothetical protein
MNRLILRSFILAAVFAAAPVALAQVTTTGQLSGTVVDAQSAVVPNAQLTVKNIQTKANYTVTTNKDGNWTLPSIPSGSYTVTITAPGFKTTVVQEVKVEVGQPATVNATLEVGGVDDQVVVTGGGEVLQTTSEGSSPSPQPIACWSACALSSTMRRRRRVRRSAGLRSSIFPGMIVTASKSPQSRITRWTLKP